MFNNRESLFQAASILSSLTRQELNWRFFVTAKHNTLYSDKIISSYWRQVWCQVYGCQRDHAFHMHLQRVYWEPETHAFRMHLQRREINQPCNLRSAPESTDTQSEPCVFWNYLLRLVTTCFASRGVQEERYGDEF